MELIFVAGPYGTDPEIKEARAKLIAQVCINLMSAGKIAISPLIYGLGLICIAESDLPDTFGVWDLFCTTFVEASKKFYVVDMIGWQMSNGLKAEMLKAYELKIPIFLVDPVTLEEKKSLEGLCKLLSILPGK